MTAPTHALPEHDLARLTALRELTTAKEQYGRVPTVLLAELAQALGVSKGHLSALLKEYVETGSFAPYAPRKRQDLSNEDAAQIAYFFTAGDAQGAYLLLQENDMVGRMSLRTFQRRVGTWPDWLRAAAKGGYREMIKHQMFNTEHIPYRSFAYGMDHTLLPIQVIPAKGGQPVFVWLTVVLDLKTRVVIAWLLTEHMPIIEDSTAVLAEAIDGWVCERGFVGGKPEFLRTDRGSDFISDAMNRGLLRIDVQRQFTEPYSSWQNGRVERIHGTIDREFAPRQPGYFKGGQEEYTRRVLKVTPDLQSLVTLNDLDDAFADWFDEYNNRPHRSLSGRSPLEAWFDDQHPIQKADPAEIRSAMLRSKIRTVHPYGIDFERAVYSSPNLGQPNCPVTCKVEVRYHGHKPTRLEVFREGTWICTATISTAQTREQQMGVQSRRNAQKRKAARMIANANYLRALSERERQREAGVPDADLPPLPTHPDKEAEKAAGKAASTRQPARPNASSSRNPSDAADLSRPPTQAEINAITKKESA